MRIHRKYTRHYPQTYIEYILDGDTSNFTKGDWAMLKEHYAWEEEHPRLTKMLDEYVGKTVELAETKQGIDEELSYQVGTRFNVVLHTKGKLVAFLKLPRKSRLKKRIAKMGMLSAQPLRAPILLHPEWIKKDAERKKQHRVGPDGAR